MCLKTLHLLLKNKQRRFKRAFNHEKVMFFWNEQFTFPRASLSTSAHHCHLLFWSVNAWNCLHFIHWNRIKMLASDEKNPKKDPKTFFQKTTSFCGTYSILNATSSLSKQLWLGIFHLGSVENLLALHLIQMQEPTEPHGGWKERNMKPWSWQSIAQSACYYSVPIAFTQSSCQGCVRIGLVMDCVYVCVWREVFSEFAAD